jgi:hypothetical protein
MKELLKMDQTRGLTMVAWLPTEFVEAVHREQGIDLGQLRSALDRYTILWVIDGKGDPLGDIDYQTREQLESSVKIVDSKGRRVAALSRDDVTPWAQSFAGGFEPAMRSMIGKMGQKSVLLFFPAEDADGNRIATATSPGSFSVEIGDHAFRYRTPLQTLVPPKVCPKCHEPLSGAFEFCPYDGERLPAAKKTEEAGVEAEEGKKEEKKSSNDPGR